MENKNRKQMFYYPIATKLLLHREETIAASRGNKYHDSRHVSCISHSFILFRITSHIFLLPLYGFNAYLRLFMGEFPKKAFP